MITLIQISDLHVFADPAYVKEGKAPYAELVRIIDTINQRIDGSTCILVTGDLVSDITPKAYALLSQALSRIKAPVYAIPGNHDDARMLQHHLQAPNIYHRKYVLIENWLIILLDTSQGASKLGAGYLPVAELSQLHELLARYPQHHAVIALHHPPIDFGAKWFQEIYLENKADLHACLAKHTNVKAILFGHAHTQYNAFAHSRFYSCAPSTWRQINHAVHSHAEYTKEPAGYNWYYLHGNGVIEWGTIYS